MKLIQIVLVAGAIMVMSYLSAVNNVLAEDRVITLDSEVTRLAKQYAVNEKKVRRIIQCESSGKPWAVNYNLDKNKKVWSTDHGYFQINDYFHKDQMEKLNLDIMNEWDNLEYGFLLISKQGYKPWSASKKCWDIDL